MYIIIETKRDGAIVKYRTHIHKDGGSNPAPASEIYVIRDFHKSPQVNEWAWPTSFHKVSKNPGVSSVSNDLAVNETLNRKPSFLPSSLKSPTVPTQYLECVLNMKHFYIDQVLLQCLDLSWQKFNVFAQYWIHWSVVMFLSVCV